MHLEDEEVIEEDMQVIVTVTAAVMPPGETPTLPATSMYDPAFKKRPRQRHRRQPLPRRLQQVHRRFRLLRLSTSATIQHQLQQQHRHRWLQPALQSGPRTL